MGFLPSNTHTHTHSRLAAQSHPANHPMGQNTGSRWTPVVHTSMQYFFSAHCVWWEPARAKHDRDGHRLNFHALIPTSGPLSLVSHIRSHVRVRLQILAPRLLFVHSMVLTLFSALSSLRKIVRQTESCTSCHARYSRRLAGSHDAFSDSRLLTSLICLLGLTKHPDTVVG